MLIRVLQNIAQNILRYAKSKAVISYGNEGDELVFIIKNDIKSDSKLAVEKVFTRFYTEVSSRTNTEASGLGLYLSKKLVEKMNGNMDAELKGIGSSLQSACRSTEIRCSIRNFSFAS